MFRHGSRNMNKVAVGSTFTAIAGIVYRPLLQRSSGVTSASIGSNVPLNLNILSLIPDDWTGYNYGDFWGSIGVYDEFSGVVQQWYGNNNPPAISKPGFACDGTCTGFVPSTGISWTCTNFTSSVPLLQQGENSTFYGLSTNYTRGLDANSDPILLMSISYIDSVDENCNAELITRNCNISAGTVDFPVKIVNTTIFTNEKAMPVRNFRPHPYAGDRPDAPESSESGPLGGLAWLGYTFFWSTDQIIYSNDTGVTGGFTDLTNGTMAVQYYDYSYQESPTSECSYRWFDPTNDILNAFSEVMFWTSVGAANSSTAPATFQVQQTNDRLVYTAVYSYLIVAEVVLLAAIVSVATTLYGWWHLDGAVSMNPLETARAISQGMFDRPNPESREFLTLSPRIS